MTNTHNCIEKFPTRRIDKCKGEGFNRCSGTAPMILEIWYQDQDGHEEYYDNWMEIHVNFCPFCGTKSDNFERNI